MIDDRLPPDQWTVTWDGSHGDVDGDLMNLADRVPQKIEIVTPGRTQSIRRLVCLALFDGPREGLLLTEIAHRLETSTSKVSSAIHPLKERGEIVTVATGQRRPWGAYLYRYRLSDAALETLRNQKADFAQNQRTRGGPHGG